VEARAVSVHHDEDIPLAVAHASRCGELPTIGREGRAAKRVDVAWIACESPQALSVWMDDPDVEAPRRGRVGGNGCEGDPPAVGRPVWVEAALQAPGRDAMQVGTVAPDDEDRMVVSVRTAAIRIDVADDGKPPAVR